TRFAVGGHSVVIRRPRRSTGRTDSSRTCNVRHPPTPTLFPYTTLFRSGLLPGTAARRVVGHHRHIAHAGAGGVVRERQARLAGRSGGDSRELVSLAILECGLGLGNGVTQVGLRGTILSPLPCAGERGKA